MKSFAPQENKGRTIVKALVLFAFVAGTLFILKDDTNRIGVRVHELVDTLTHQKGTMNGFFALEDDAEMCIKFEQKGPNFSSLQMTDMVPYSSFSGKFESPREGSVHIENLGGNAVPMTKFIFDTRQDGRDALQISGTDAAETFVRTTRSKCRIGARLNSCIGQLAAEKESNLPPAKMNMIVGRWTSRKGDIIVTKSVDGEENEYAFGFTGFFGFLAKKSSCFFTKELSNGDFAGLVSTTLRGGIQKDVRFVLTGDGQNLSFLNCDNTPVKISFTKAEGASTKEDL